MTTTRPFKLEPQFAERIWGKKSLLPWYAETGSLQAVGEAWLTGPECVIATGAEKGKKLKEVAEDFPLLVKMLFPAEKLSVQVHPDDEAARAMGLPRGKTECWYVLEAEAGAKVACGLRSGVSVEDLEASVAAGTTEELLEWLEVVPGDMVFVDAGTVHAIGPGMTLLEVQQTCDVTYRLFDYGRDRELHLEKGLAAVKLKTDAGKVASKEHQVHTTLIEAEYFVVDLFELGAGLTMEMSMDGVGCVVGLKGNGAVNEVRFGVGEAVVMPAGSVTVGSADGMRFVRVWEPKE